MLNLFGINVKDAREKVFLSADAKKVLTPKKTMHSATIDGKELSITYRVGKELEQMKALAKGYKISLVNWKIWNADMCG